MQMFKVMIVAVDVSVDAIAFEQRLQVLGNGVVRPVIAARKNGMMADDDLPA